MYKKTVLENGVRVVTETMPDVRSLTIGLLVEAGSRHEPDDIAGVAHCIEHLLFKGTGGRDATTLAQMIDMAGGQLGAFTARDYTCLFAAVLDDYRTYALDIFGDVMLHSLFETESLEREKEAISQEIEFGDEQPAKYVQEVLKQSSWPGSSLGRNIYGSVETLRSLTRPDLLNFFQNFYGSSRIIVAAAGNLEHEDFASQVNDVLWALPDAADKFAENIDPPEFVGSVQLKLREQNHIHFALGAPAPSYTDPDRYAVYVLNNLLGVGMSSRLYQQVRSERGWVYEIGSLYHPYKQAGMMLVEGFTTPRNLFPVVDSVVGELINLLQVPVSEEELWRAKEHLRGEILLGAEASNTRMSQLATQELYFGRFFSPQELVEQVRAITPLDIMRVAEKMFEPGNLSLSAIGPFGQLGSLEQIQTDLGEMLGLY